MTQTGDSWDGVVDQLTAHYDHGLLPDEGPIWGDETLAVVAVRHANAIAWRLTPEQANKAAERLERVSAARRCEEIVRLSRATRYDWSADDDDWKAMSQLLQAIAAALRSR